jgi:hypothetical protein
MCRAALPIVVFVSVCAAQSDLPPERLRLVQIRERMRQNQARIPNYTCLETITRARRPASSLVISANGKPARFLRQDVVRLEVAEVDGKEFFAWPGARNFTETEMTTFVTGGMIGNGVFTSFAREVFNPTHTGYQFAGESNDTGRPLFRYDYQVTLLVSGYRLKTIHGEAVVAYHGSIWADAKTLDTVRLDIQAEGIPLQLGVAAASTRIDYSTVRIGAADVLLPQSAEMTIYGSDGWDDRNTIAFTHCKEYGAASVISFEAPDILPSTAAPPGREVEIPAGLTLHTALETAIDSNTAAPGAVVHARVQADVRHKGAVLIPKDTIVTGYIRRFDQYLTAPRHFVVALEFYRFEFPRGPVRFFAGLERIVALPGSAPLAVVPADLPGVATFSVKGDTLLLPPGTRLVWKTSRYAAGSP